MPPSGQREFRAHDVPGLQRGGRDRGCRRWRRGWRRWWPGQRGHRDYRGADQGRSGEQRVHWRLPDLRPHGGPEQGEEDACEGEQHPAGQHLCVMGGVEAGDLHQRGIAGRGDPIARSLAAENARKATPPSAAVRASPAASRTVRMGLGVWLIHFALLSCDVAVDARRGQAPSHRRAGRSSDRAVGRSSAAAASADWPMTRGRAGYVCGMHLRLRDKRQRDWLPPGCCRRLAAAALARRARPPAGRWARCSPPASAPPSRSGSGIRPPRASPRRASWRWTLHLAQPAGRRLDDRLVLLAVWPGRLASTLAVRGRRGLRRAHRPAAGGPGRQPGNGATRRSVRPRHRGGHAAPPPDRRRP